MNNVIPFKTKAAVPPDELVEAMADAAVRWLDTVEPIREWMLRNGHGCEGDRWWWSSGSALSVVGDVRRWVAERSGGPR